MKGEERYFAITEGDDTEEFVIQTLTGEFQRKGDNHGRPFYQKVPPKAGVPPPEVFIYYWDERDGESFSGWWFGKAVGGNEVWSHSADSAKLPPLGGWKIPFTGDVRDTFLVMPRSQKVRKDASNKADLLKSLEEEAQELITESVKSVEKARAAMRAFQTQQDKFDIEAIKEAHLDIQPHTQIFNDMIAKVEGSGLGDVSRAVLRKIREAQSAVAMEAQKLKVALPKASKQIQQKQSEVRDDKLLAEMMLGVNEKFEAAEDLVEKAELTFGLVEHAGEDEEEALKAAEQTETIAKQAQAAVKEGLGAIGQKLALLKDFESDTGRLKATDSLGTLREKLREANAKLAPFLAAKVESKQRVEAKKLDLEICELLAPAEKEVEAAEQIAEPLVAYAKVAQQAAGKAAEKTARPKAKAGDKTEKDGKDDSVQKRTPPNPEIVESAMHRVANAVTSLLGVTKVVEQKRHNQTVMFSHVLKKVLDKAEERVRAAQKRLDRIRSAQKEIKEMETAQNLMGDVEEKTQAAEEAVKVAEDAVRAIGNEGSLIDSEEEAIKVAAKAAAAAKICISMKLLEVKRFTAEAGIEAQKILTEHQTKLQAALQKIEDCKKQAGEKKSLLKRKDALAKVEVAEEHALKAEAAAEIILDDAQLKGMTSTEIREAGAITRKAADAAMKAAEEAQVLITSLQIAAKGSSASEEATAELSKLQARLKAAEATIAPFAVLPDVVEKQLKIQSVIDAAELQVSTAEDKVEAAAKLASEAEENPWPDSEAPPAPVPVEDPPPSSGPRPKTRAKPAPQAPPVMLSIAMENPVDRAKTAIENAQKALSVATAFIEAQVKDDKMPDDDAEGMNARLEAAKHKLTAAEATADKGFEQREVLQLIGDVDKKTIEAEASVEAVAKLAGPLAELMAKHTDDKDEGGSSSLEAALAEMKAAAKTAAANCSSVKTSIAVKRIQAKRLAGAAPEICREQLDELGEKIEAGLKRLTEVRQASMDRQFAKAKTTSTASVEKAGTKVAAATAAYKALLELSDGADPEQMQDVLSKAASAQGEASFALSAARGPLENVLNEAYDDGLKSETDDRVKEFEDMLETLSPLEKELDDMQKKAKDKEHKFVAACLLSEATDMFEQLEEKIKTMNDASAALVATDKGKSLVAQVRLGYVLQALRSHMIAASKTPETLFEELAKASGENGTIEAPKIPAALRALVPEIPELPELFGTKGEDDKLVAASFSALFCSGDAGDAANTSIEKDKFLDELKVRYICVGSVSMTQDLEVEESATLRKLEVSEILEALGPASKDEKSDLMRVFVKALSDDSEGFVTLAGSGGSTYLEVYSPALASIRKAEIAVADVSESVTQTIAYLKEKNEDLKTAGTSGPLGEVKVELGKLRVRASRAQASQGDSKRKVETAKKSHEAEVEAHKKRQQDVADKKVADKMVEDITELVDGMTTKAGEACDEAAKLVAGDSAISIKDLLHALKKSEADLQAIISETAKAQEQVMKVVTDQIGNVSKGPLVEARRLIFRLKVKLAPIPVNCKKQLSALEAKQLAAAQDAEQSVAAAVQEKVKAGGLTADSFFDKLRSDNDPPHSCMVQTAALRDFLKGSLDEEELKAGLAGFDETLSRLSVSGLVQQYRKCIKEVALTPNAEVKGSVPIRKIEPDEIIEVFGKPAKEEGTGLQRTRCRALKDLAEGWVTVFGNQGTTFVEKMDKPYVVCEAEAPLQESCASSSPELRKLVAGEVLEMVEGPREETAVEITRAKGKSAKDGATGWVLFKDEHGQCFFESQKLMTCKKSGALTDGFDISACSAIRKLEIGELLEMMDEPKEDEKRKVLRVQVKARTDGKEGWVTVKGNQGTVYVEESKLHWNCSKEVELENDDGTTRNLEVGEPFELLMEPATEMRGGKLLARVRSKNRSSTPDAPVEGWVVVGEAVLPWVFRQQVVQACSMMDGIDEHSTVVREVAANEEVELLEVPRSSDEDSNAFFSHVRATQDGAVGFLPFLGKEGKVLLESRS
eukprot:TRINITY_DN72104_c0_g1_i1.p1 TRINITY_DN72104_c0_g1~~TRINITY_DN72104_c0_g1_i1.p1  ORF type:complete len:2124 (-),score=625.86 TRINITY_DN72104_c0_g1_i1:161-6175(-)